MCEEVRSVMKSGTKKKNVLQDVAIIITGLALTFAFFLFLAFLFIVGPSALFMFILGCIGMGSSY